MNDNTCSDLTVSTDAIKASPLGEELSDAQCELLASVMTACGIRDRDFLIEEGHKDDSLHIFLLGEFVFANILVGTRYETLQIYLYNMRQTSGHFTSALVMTYFLFIFLLTWLASRFSQGTK